MKVLVSTYPYAGHVNPTQPVVCELVRRGHDVVWMTGPVYEARVRQTGARFVPMSPDALIDDEHIHVIHGKVTLAKVADYLRRLFLDRIPAQVRDYEGVAAAADGFVPDVLVVDFCTYAARCYMDRAGLPYATLGINPLVTLDPEIPPWGSGEQPPRTAGGRLRNRVRHALGIVFFISRLSAALNKQRRALGLPPRSRWRSYADDVRSPDLHIMMTTPAFELPRKNMLRSVVFVGPLLPSWLDGDKKGDKKADAKTTGDASTLAADATPSGENATSADAAQPTDRAPSANDVPPADTTPPWWDEMLAHPRERVVHLTQGTIATNTDLLVKPTVEALADRGDLLVIVTGKNVEALFESDPPAGTAMASAGPRTVGAAETNVETVEAVEGVQGVDTSPKMKRPANVRTAAFVPHLRLLPHVGVMVTNAGYNGVLAALSCGVPLVCAGRTEDKADVSSRVAWSGAGIDLATAAPTTEAVRAAVLRIVDGDASARAPRNKKKGGPLALHPPGHDYRAVAARIRDDFARHNGPAEAADALEALVRQKAQEKAVAETLGRMDSTTKRKRLQPKPLRDSMAESAQS
ncbi:hypothetical protein SPBR_07010 [Sporothrix brasiliensis 5110]|uniref:Erythromycin biosynthesis protein CIII-like C-terminal domain-containing protein n=1 Tax=Sporothrix brasiliensis 5110 TaxID=1398154 RepID=A0A0C2IR47_9PEZI|nr:uncharacterized protein SPBR_07010 [Sporothrix brasiliensis 5110]KIH89355.1 hypothetical protein SPBR_07010 [Sporothrix brasiliensis 5110]